MKPKNKKDAVVSLAEHRLRRGSPQILTEVVASSGDRSAGGLDSDITGLLVSQVVPVDELSVLRNQQNNTPPDDLIA